MFLDKIVLLYQGNEGTAALEKYMRTEYADDDRKWVVLFPEETILEAGSDKSKRLVEDSSRKNKSA